MEKMTPNPVHPCAPREALDERPLIDQNLAASLEAIFKVLANRTRLRILHALVREPGLPAGSLARAIGMKPQAVSNQLQRLVDKGILVAERNGTQVRYWILDPCVIHLLDRGLCLLEDRELGCSLGSGRRQ